MNISAVMASHTSKFRYQMDRNSLPFLFEWLFFMMTSFVAVARRVGVSGKLKKSSAMRMCENAPFCANTPMASHEVTCRQPKTHQETTQCPKNQLLDRDLPLAT